ncbi:hypothetical protein N7533_008920 [Penicillium manginii]|uniref:uncharacterized protein n=1 Tax=Penicillium manginii TaxID=203109 RepID=UPI00254875EE|nr:uncharacterized protein N7533_008920 [Penicillium manginii]KAJ5744050.1 hypothetical protein N7533_008920 [Penicillium manginii]
MRFFIVTSLLAALAAATSTDNDFSNPAGGYSFTAGSSTTLTWDHKVGSTVTLRLQSGSITTATSGTVIASNIDNTGSFTWTVPKNLVKGKEYTIEIINDDDTSEYNFLPYFTVAGATGAASTSTAASTTTEASTTSTTEASTTSTSTSTEATTTTTTEASTTEASTTTTSTAAKTTATTLTKASSSAATTTTSSESTTTASTSSASSSSASASATAVPGNGAGVNRVSSAMLALVAGAIAMM